MDDKETKQFNEIRYNKVRDELEVLKNEAIQGLKESSLDQSRPYFMEPAHIFLARCNIMEQQKDIEIDIEHIGS